LYSLLLMMYSMPIRRAPGWQRVQNMVSQVDTVGTAAVPPAAAARMIRRANAAVTGTPFATFETHVVLGGQALVAVGSCASTLPCASSVLWVVCPQRDTHGAAVPCAQWPVFKAPSPYPSCQTSALHFQEAEALSGCCSCLHARTADCT
jgi:hypothetical protein